MTFVSHSLRSTAIYVAYFDGGRTINRRKLCGERRILVCGWKSTSITTIFFYRHDVIRQSFLTSQNLIRGKVRKFHSPDKVLAVTAKGRLLEEPRNEAMILDVVHVLLLQRSLASAIFERKFAVGISFLAHVVIGHDRLLSKTFFFSKNFDLCAQRRDFYSLFFSWLNTQKLFSSQTTSRGLTESTFSRKGKPFTRTGDECLGASNGQSHQIAKRERFPTGKWNWNFAQDGGGERKKMLQNDSFFSHETTRRKHCQRRTDVVR